MELDSSQTTSSEHNADDLNIIYEAIQFPLLLTRVKAVFLDTIIWFICFATISVLIDNLGRSPQHLTIGWIVFTFLYDPVLTAFAGATIGHKLMGIKVRRMNAPENKISLPMAFLRSFIKGLLGWIALLTVTSNSHKRAMHDFASGSVVIPARSFDK